MKRSEETWWTIKFLKYYGKKFRVFFLFWRFSFILFFFLFNSTNAHRRHQKSFFFLFFSLKTKKLWLKEESVIGRVVILVGVSCRRHLSIWLKHHGMEFSSLSPVQRSRRFFSFPQKPFFFLRCFLICFHSFFQNSTTCFDLCIGRWMMCMLLDLKTIIVIHSRSHYEMRRSSWRNLDLEKKKFFFSKLN